ncbi:MAG: hypothetical protein P8O97_02175 [Gammaproteobacteria bacterium]|jgi:hypothetical protein|nr:hypothetical protein [Gammaproteobacteria bacterium]|tara:strand:- start:47248 stop:48282 length:1035 start_codon:yes stop_codon:yes gene_type:complete
MNTDLLSAQVQRNCNIADARYAGNFTLCIYLMKMREFYRWSERLAYEDTLTSSAVGEWVTEREALWEALEEDDFQELNIDGHVFDPFDTVSINQHINPQGLIYSGGLGANRTPHFFLAEKLSSESHHDTTIFISGQEYARDLASPPAMTLGNNIFIRRQSIARMIWERIQEWQWHGNENGMSRAMKYYAFADDTHSALQAMAEIEAEAIKLHEIGEIEASLIIGPDWKKLLLEINNPRVELKLRAIKDLFADALSTLPALIESEKIASIHFYAGNMNATRKELCPSFTTAYNQWHEDTNYENLADWVNLSRHYWHDIMKQCLSLFAAQKTSSEIDAFLIAETFK